MSISKGYSTGQFVGAAFECVIKMPFELCLMDCVWAAKQAKHEKQSEAAKMGCLCLGKCV